MPDDFGAPRIALPGMLVVQAMNEDADPEKFCQAYARASAMNPFPLVVLVDDSEFATRSLNNFLWVTFTRSNPAVDVYGIGSFVCHKHWGCKGPLIIDARIKPHHAPVLEKDEKVDKRIERLFNKGGSLYGVLKK